MKRGAAQHRGVAVAFSALRRARINSPTVANNQNNRFRHKTAPAVFDGEGPTITPDAPRANRQNFLS